MSAQWFFLHYINSSKNKFFLLLLLHFGLREKRCFLKRFLYLVLFFYVSVYSVHKLFVIKITN